MIKFLPEKNKKEIKIEYFSRVVVLVLIFLVFLGVFGVFSLFPGYIISYYRDISIAEQSKSAQLNKVDVSVQEKTVKTTNELISFLTQLEDKKPSVPMFNILAKVNSYIRITQISYTKDKDGFKFIVKGTAKTREGLITFIRDLKADKNLSGVSLPVSDFVKSSDIDFSLNILSK